MGVTLHEMVRRAVRADLRLREPERERELRRRIADHLYGRAARGESHLLVDLAELIDNPALRWGLGAEGSVDFRVDDVRPEDFEAADERVTAPTVISLPVRTHYSGGYDVAVIGGAVVSPPDAAACSSRATRSWQSPCCC